MFNRQVVIYTFGPKNKMRQSSVFLRPRRSQTEMGFPGIPHLKVPVYSRFYMFKESKLTAVVKYIMTTSWCCCNEYV